MKDSRSYTKVPISGTTRNTRNAAHQDTAYLVLGPDRMQFIGRGNLSEPACIAYDSLTCKPVAIGSQADNVANNGHCGVYWPLKHTTAFPDIITDLTSAFARRIVNTVDPVINDLVVVLPHEACTKDVMRAVQCVMRNVFGCKTCRFSELKDPEEEGLEGIVFHEVPERVSLSTVETIATAAITCLAAMCSIISGVVAADVVFISLLVLAVSCVTCMKIKEVTILRKEQIVKPTTFGVDHSLLTILIGSLMFSAFMFLTDHIFVFKAMLILATFSTVFMQSEALQTVCQQVRHEHIVNLQWHQNLIKTEV